MKALSLTALLVFVIHALVAQSTIVVEEVIFTGPGSECKVPRVKDKANPNNPAVTKINSVLLDRFDLQSFDPKEAEGFSYYNLSFTSQIKSGLLYIEYAGEYSGAYLSPVEEELFFNLSTGDLMKNVNIPFQSLFTPDGYLQFMNAHWLAAAKKAFQEATTCSDLEPSCSYYDIGYGIEGSSLVVSMNGDCYPHAARSCNPEVTRSVAMDSVKKYLSPAGEKILLRDSYASKRGIDKYLYNNQATKELGENLYMFGLIDGKYPFSMAITIASGTVKGFYYYDKRKQKIALTGTAQQGVMQLKEAVNGQVTGEFAIQWNSDYQENASAVYDLNNNMLFLTGQWKSPDGKKIMPITFTAAKFTNKRTF